MPWIFAEHIRAAVDNLVDFGSSVARWRKIWSTDADFSGVVTVSRTPVAATDAANKAYADTLGGGLTVQQVTGGSVVAGTTVLKFNEVQGFAVTNPSGTIARVDITAIPDASIAALAASKLTGTVSAAKGGTALDTSGSTGCPIIDTGTWSVPAALTVAKGGTGLTASPITVALGGTGTTSTLSGYVKGGSPMTAQATPLPAADLGSGSGAAKYLRGDQTWNQITLTAAAAEVTGNLPVANLNSGTGASATTFWRGDATWAAAAGTIVPIFDKSAVSISVSNTVTETTLYTKSVPGNTLGATGKFRVTLLGRITDTSVVLVTGIDTWITRCKFGGTTLTSITNATGSDNGTTHVAIGSSLAFRLVFELQNLNATGSQAGTMIVESTASSVSATNPTSMLIGLGAVVDNPGIGQMMSHTRGTSAIDTTGAAILLITGQWSVNHATKTFVMDSVVVEQF